MESSCFSSELIFSEIFFPGDHFFSALLAPSTNELINRRKKINIAQGICHYVRTFAKSGFFSENGCRKFQKVFAFLRFSVILLLTY
jgi:hypothetical protein